MFTLHCTMLYHAMLYCPTLVMLYRDITNALANANANASAVIYTYARTHTQTLVPL